MGLTVERDQGEKLPEYDLVTFQGDLGRLEDFVSADVLYDWLSQSHEHFYEDQQEMEADFEAILAKGGTIIVGINSTGSLVSFVSCRPVEMGGAKCLIANNLTSTTGSPWLLKAMGRRILENHPDCDYVAHSIRPNGSKADQRLARIYQRLGFQPDGRWISQDPERVPVSMSMDNFRTIVERR